ncbi:hypothetical protein ACIBQX_35570 [Nonomuraea sp. NPDC049714]|uniref:hypothetical protein n=1 Tax=Nonomuraea sp. NPDC049714 TaxID=3364357 RepID=UPI0037BC1F9C
MTGRLAYLTVTNSFAALRLLSMGDRDKDVEILTLRHQMAMPACGAQEHESSPALSGTPYASTNGSTTSTEPTKP